MLPISHRLAGWRYYIEYRLGAKHAYTQTSIAEQQCLCRHATGKKRLVEIGVYQGANTLKFREVMDPQGLIIGVDPYYRSLRGLKGSGWTRCIAHAEVAKSQHGSVIWIEDLGKNAVNHPSVQSHLPVDFLFIDGDHSWQGIAGDWEAWNHHIVRGGIVALHDSINSELDSARFTREVIVPDQRFSVVETVDTLTILKAG